MSAAHDMAKCRSAEASTQLKPSIRIFRVAAGSSKDYRSIGQHGARCSSVMWTLVKHQLQPYAQPHRQCSILSCMPVIAAILCSNTQHRVLLTLQQGNQQCFCEAPQKPLLPMTASAADTLSYLHTCTAEAILHDAPR